MKKLKILFALFVVLALPWPAYAQKTKAALTTEVGTNLASSSGITAATLRTTLIDMINSWYDLNGSSSSACASNTFVSSFPTLSSVTCTQPTIANLSGFGTGVATALGVNVGTAGAFVVNGGVLGIPSSGTLTNATGLPVSTGLTGAGTGVLTALGVNVGTAGAVVVNGGALGTPASGTLTNATGLPISGVSGLGTGVATALGNTLNAASGLVGFSGALGTPSSGTLTNATGLPNAGLINSTISGVALGSNLNALTFGTHLAAGGSSYNGSTGVTISTDATNLDTVSTLVARDAGGNFSAGTITAALTGHASLDLPLAGGTLSGQLTSTLATGTAPFSVASSTNVANLNASSLNGATFANPGSIGSGTAASGAFTTLSASGVLSFPANSLSLAEFPTIGVDTVLGSIAGGTPAALSQAQLTSLINPATTSVLGAVKPDGTTITISGGVITASGGSATAVTVGTTNVVSGTAHGVLLADSILANTGAGTTGQALVSNGAGADPTYQSGGWVLLNTLVASNSATLSDTTHITASYNEYLLVFENIVAGTSGGQELELQVHSNGSFQTTGYTSTTAITSSTQLINNATTFVQLSRGDVQNSGAGFSGELTVFTPSGAAAPKTWSGQGAHLGSTNFTVENFTGAWAGGNTAVDGFQVMFGVGNIASGTVKLYGRL
jgi:hypothetical protein